MIRVIDKVFDIIEMIATDPEKAWPLASIADPLKMNHGTCANILKTLVGRNYIEKLPARKGYKLGMKAYTIGGKKDYKDELVRSAQSEMTKLTTEFKENTLLSVLQGSQRIAILRVNCENQIQVITPVEKNAYDSSTGRLLVAMQSDEQVERYIQQYGLPKHKGKGRELSKSAFMQEVNKIRTEGFASWLPDDHILGMAFPIYQKNRLIASLSMYAPAYRCSPAKRLKMRRALQKAAANISSALSYAL